MQGKHCNYDVCVHVSEYDQRPNAVFDWAPILICYRPLPQAVYIFQKIIINQTISYLNHFKIFFQPFCDQRKPISTNFLEYKTKLTFFYP